MKFSAIADKLRYPAKFSQRLRTEHMKIIDYAVRHCQSNRQWERTIIKLMNSVTCAIVEENAVAIDYGQENMLDHISVLLRDNEEMRRFLQESKCDKLFIEFKNVEWDIEPVEQTKQPARSVPAPEPQEQTASAAETPKEDLYLRAPQFPRYDVNKYWLSQRIGNEHFYIYPSLPAIPEKQNDVSCTTDAAAMTDRDLLRLYPNHLIRTRNAVMYEPADGIDYDDELGLILPIKGFTRKQLRDNLIQYPHFYQLTRTVGEEDVSFYKHIEIDGVLHDTLEVWDSLPDTAKLPKTAEFIKEYIIRRYLLERDSGIEHKYPLRGSLLPYLTLFAPADFYVKNGCGDPAELARQCVTARADFFRSRNPYLTRYHIALEGGPAYGTVDCPFKQYCRRDRCNASCPSNAEISYLLERNCISQNDPVFMIDDRMLSEVSEWLTAASGCYKVVISPDSSETASALLYAAICQSWYGNRLHCAVYHLNFANYLDSLQKSWGMTSLTDEMEYEQIFVAKAKVLVISNIEFIKFNDFAAQTLLNLIHTRKTQKLSSIVVSPKISTLMGNGQFYERMKQVLGEVVLNK
ncbi:hypothetical protein [Ruminococcus sp.]|uniref:hypothetical protein n=1 Tax=Ruminococcus sp. TaxID=41978 RepID=UPI001B7C67C6|nr:hypothetical protein [Ruminococcus sp.]MBP5433749.1 hypothetical protein [Ruminococcus sp.]